MLLGSLLTQLHAKKLWPWPDPKLIRRSLITLLNDLRCLDTPSRCACRRKNSSHVHCTLRSHIDPSLNSVSQLVKEQRLALEWPSRS